MDPVTVVLPTTPNDPVIPTEPVNVWVLVISFPNRFDPLE